MNAMKEQMTLPFSGISEEKILSSETKNWLSRTKTEFGKSETVRNNLKKLDDEATYLKTKIEELKKVASVDDLKKKKIEIEKHFEDQQKLIQELEYVLSKHVTTTTETPTTTQTPEPTQAPTTTQTPEPTPDPNDTHQVIKYIIDKSKKVMKDTQEKFDKIVNSNTVPSKEFTLIYNDRVKTDFISHKLEKLTADNSRINNLLIQKIEQMLNKHQNEMIEHINNYPTLMNYLSF